MRIWITYAWKDNQDGDFDYLVQELKKEGIEAIFDKVALIPGQKLWEQIGEKITNGNFDGWAYLITPNSLSSQPCKEELEYAINRAISNKSENFPLIGLVHGVPFNDVPISLKVRLCVNLSGTNWIEEIKAGLEIRPAKTISQSQTQYICKVSEKYNGVSKSIIVEIKPRFGEVMFWRVMVPTTTPVYRWGWGMADGSDTISPMMTSTVDGGTGELNGVPITWFGAGDKLSPSTAAKIIFDNHIPDFIGFSLSNGQFGEPTNPIEIYNLK